MQWDPWACALSGYCEKKFLPTQCSTASTRSPRRRERRQTHWLGQKIRMALRLDLAELLRLDLDLLRLDLAELLRLDLDLLRLDLAELLRLDLDLLRLDLDLLRHFNSIIS
ncbi:hypothetical protein niasHT_007406 [Heterodera trifolii]|uniref:Uncharacterized protein n=1 Tax=Heterodera trifolii TaxID=157864 RepID=A0ABD2LLK0_9BILA